MHNTPYYTLSQAKACGYFRLFLGQSACRLASQKVEGRTPLRPFVIAATTERGPPFSLLPTEHPTGEGAEARMMECWSAGFRTVDYGPITS